MKVFLTIAALLFTSNAVWAQTEAKPYLNTGTPGKRGTVNICTVSRSKLLTPPLYLIYSNNKLVYRSDTGKAVPSPLNMVDQYAIRSMNIVKDSTATQRFGVAGKGGVIEIYLDEKKFPDAYKVFTSGVKESEKQK